MPEIIIPAVNGTKSILESAIKHGYVLPDEFQSTLRSVCCSTSSSIKRIVVTSSTVSIGLSPRAESQRTEEDWNEPALKEVRELGKDASGLAKYSASKTLAEKGGSNFHSARPS
jgi:nucleoside-diphosphate-sugar epimerase